MKINTTKSKLLSSLLILVLCVTAFFGSTYAWFTDSVTSTGNKIVAGELKVDLEVLENGQWHSIKNSKEALFNYDKWEPGYTDVTILKVENEGTLALKWNAQFVSDAALTGLADVIDVYVLPSATDPGYPADRNLTGYTKVGTVADFVNTIETTTTGELAPNGVAYLGIALKMQEEAGNEYQGMSLGGSFDIKVNANQKEAESDSFGTEYDKNAGNTGASGVINDINVSAPVAVANDVTTAEVTVGAVNSNGAEVTVPVGAKVKSGVTEVELVVEPTDVPADLTVDDGKVAKTYDISVVGLARDNTEPVEVKINIGTGRNITTLKLYHDTEQIAYDSYDPATGILSFKTATFSPFTVVYAASEMEAFKWELNAAKAGDTVTLNLTADAYMGAGEMNVAPQGVHIVVNGNGHTIYADNATHVFGAKRDSNMTIKNVTIVGSTTDDAIISQNDGVGNPVKIVMENVKVNLTDIKGVNWPVCFGGNGAATLTNCVITGAGLESGDYADGNQFFAGAQMKVTVVNSKIDSVMLNGNANASATLNIDAASNVDTVILEAKDPKAVTGTVSSVKKMMIPASTESDLKLADNGLYVILANNITTSEKVAVNNKATLDGNGKTIDFKGSFTGYDKAVSINNGTLKNINVNNAGRAVGADGCKNDIYLDNVTITNARYSFNGDTTNNSSVYFTNSTIDGWISYGGQADIVSFKNCNLIGKTSKYYGLGYYVVHSNALFENCTFDNFYLGMNKGALNSGAAGTTVTIKDCVVIKDSEQVKLTAENFKSLMMGPGDEDDFGRMLEYSVIVVDGVTVAK